MGWQKGRFSGRGGSGMVKGENCPLFGNRARWTGRKSGVSRGRRFVAIGADGRPGSFTESVGKPAEILPARRCVPEGCGVAVVGASDGGNGFPSVQVKVEGLVFLQVPSQVEKGFAGGDDPGRRRRFGIGSFGPLQAHDGQALELGQLGKDDGDAEEGAAVPLVGDLEVRVGVEVLAEIPALFGEGCEDLFVLDDESAAALGGAGMEGPADAEDAYRLEGGCGDGFHGG